MDGENTSTNTNSAASTGENNGQETTTAANVAASNQTSANSQQGKDNKSTEIQKLIQAAVDRATNKLGNDNKFLREELDELRKSKLTDDELKDAQIRQREKDIAEREAELKTEKNRMYAITKIRGSELDDGTDTTLGLVDLVMADDEKGIDARIATLSAYVNSITESRVNRAFAARGRQPGQANNSENDNKKTNIGRDIGKKTAAINKASKSILDYYTGGKK